MYHSIIYASKYKYTLLNTPEYLEGLSFSATFGEAEKLEVVGSKVKNGAGKG